MLPRTQKLCVNEYFYVFTVTILKARKNWNSFYIIFVWENLMWTTYNLHPIQMKST